MEVCSLFRDFNEARGTLSGLIAVVIYSIPELSLRSNTGLKLANAFGVIATYT